MTRTDLHVITSIEELLLASQALPPPIIEAESFPAVCERWFTDPGAGSIVVPCYDLQLWKPRALPTYTYLPAAGDGYLFDRPINVIYANTEYQIESRVPTRWPANVMIPAGADSLFAEIPEDAPIRVVYLRKRFSFMVSSPTEV